MSILLALVNKMKQPPKILQTKIMAQSRLFTIEAVDLQFSNGEQRTFERLQRRQRGAVMIVPLTDTGELLLIREYAVGVERYLLGFPKGLIDNEETAIVAANRELKEEISHGARHLQVLRRFAASPSYMNSCITVILAQDLYHEKLFGDEPEPLELVKWPLNDYANLLQKEEFAGAMSTVALLLAKEVLLVD